MSAFMKPCSLTKNVVPLTKVAPRPVITWDKHERLNRNKEIWDDPKSIVHRLPKHYQEVWEHNSKKQRNNLSFSIIGRILF